MREQLKHYVDLLFAGSSGTEDMKQEILQNTLERYDDLVAGGKAPEAAYSLAIAGIGDLGEILQGTPQPRQVPTVSTEDTPQKKSKLLKAIAVGLYILCAVPILIIQNEVGVCLTLVIVAIATGLIVMSGNKREEKEGKQELSPREKMKRSIGSVIWAVGLVLYFILSFTTDAWHITWLVFPLCAAVKGLASAIMDYREEK